MTELLRYDFSEQGLNACLSALGTTPDEVAERLSALGFRGWRGSSVDCPLARYVRTSVDGTKTCDVQADSDDEVYVRASRDDGLVDAFAPAAAYGFVLKFDLGDFPDLIEGGPTSAA